MAVFKRLTDLPDAGAAQGTDLVGVFRAGMKQLSLTNLKNWILSGLGNSATRNVGTAAGTVAAGDDARFGAGGASGAAGGALAGTYPNPTLANPVIVSGGTHPHISLVADGSEFVGDVDNTPYYGWDSSASYYLGIGNKQSIDALPQFPILIQQNGVVKIPKLTLGYLGLIGQDTFGRTEGNKGALYYGTDGEDLLRVFSQSAVGNHSHSSALRIDSCNTTAPVLALDGATGQTDPLVQMRQMSATGTPTVAGSVDAAVTDSSDAGFNSNVVLTGRRAGAAASEILRAGPHHSTYRYGLTFGGVRLFDKNDGSMGACTPGEDSFIPFGASEFQVSGTKVIAAQQPAIANADGTLPDITTKFNSLLGALRTHGLIAT